MNRSRPMAALAALVTATTLTAALTTALTTAPAQSRAPDYEPAPGIVEGTDDELFLGNDLDFACGLGRRLEATLQDLSKLARVIERSGRRVVFTLSPNKSAVLTKNLPRPLPHGACDRKGLRAQDAVLRTYDDPAYLSLVGPLRRSAHQAYWKTDQHWTTVGGAVFATELAAHLDPRLARRQRYAYGTETRMGDLARALGRTDPETLETARPTTRVTSRAVPGTEEWAGYPEFTFEHTWTTTPRKRTWPGRTLVLGDSFGWFALENLRPLFRRGHFVWVDHTGVDVPAAIRDSDTVVIQVLQLFGPSSTLLTTSFRRSVRSALTG